MNEYPNINHRIDALVTAALTGKYERN